MSNSVPESSCHRTNRIKHFAGLSKDLTFQRGSPQVVRNPPASAGDTDSIPGLGRCPGGGNGNALQNSCLGNPMGRGPGGFEPTGLQRGRHDRARTY